MADLNNLRDLVIKMKVLMAQKEDQEVAVKATNAELDDLRLKQIPEMCEALGIKNATFEGVGRVQLATDLYCSTKAGQKDTAMQWLRDCGYEDMVSETYNASSMKALIRRLIEEGTEIPEFMNVTPFIRASVVKA